MCVCVCVGGIDLQCGSCASVHKLGDPMWPCTDDIALHHTTSVTPLVCLFYSSGVRVGSQSEGSRGGGNHPSCPLFLLSVSLYLCVSLSYCQCLILSCSLILFLRVSLRIFLLSLSRLTIFNYFLHLPLFVLSLFILFLLSLLFFFHYLP